MLIEGVSAIVVSEQQQSWKLCDLVLFDYCFRKILNEAEIEAEIVENGELANTSWCPFLLGEIEEFGTIPWLKEFLKIFKSSKASNERRHQSINEFYDLFNCVDI